MKSIFISLVFVLCINFGSYAQNFQDLKSIEELQKQFVSDAGKVRIITLLSPT